MDSKRHIAIAQPSIGSEEWEALKAPIESGWLTQGTQVAAFEQVFSKLHKVQHAIAVSNCTTALHLSLVAAGIAPGDEVIVPAFTWISTANVVEYCGAKPVFIDIDPDTFNMDPRLIAGKITAKTRAIIPVHLFGLCMDVETLRSNFPTLIIIEDAACAAGASWLNKPAGSMGHAGCFSFHPRKSITTGEGGMITTQDNDWAEKLNQLRNHGASVSEEQRHLGNKPYLLAEYDVLGYNYRMTDLQGAVGRVQLQKLTSLIDERNQWALFYQEQLAGVKWLKLPQTITGCKHGWQAFVTLIDESAAPMSRNELMEKLQQQGISTRPGTHAVHMQGYYKNKYGYKPEDFPMAYRAHEFSMAIPLHNRMTKEDYLYVVNALKSI